MIRGERARERERERASERKRERERERERERAAVESQRKRARVYPARSQPQTFQNDSNSESTLSNDQVRFHRLYRYVCARIFIESRLACLATDINMILYLYLTFFY